MLESSVLPTVWSLVILGEERISQIEKKNIFDFFKIIFLETKKFVRMHFLKV